MARKRLLQFGENGCCTRCGFYSQRAREETARDRLALLSMISAIRPLLTRLAAIELPILALLVVGSIISERLLPAALIVAAGFWPVRWLANGRPTVRTPGDWPVGLLVAMVPVTLWATAQPETTRTEVFRLLTGIALFYAVVNWAGSTVRLLLVTAGLAATGLGLAALAPFLGGLPTISGLIPAGLEYIFQRISSTVNPNVIAGALSVLAPIAIALFLFPLPRRWLGVRALGLVAALAMIGVIVLTASRGAWMGVVAAVLLLIASRWRWGWLATPLVAVAAGLAAWQISFGRVADAMLASQALGGADQRVEIWSRAIYMLQDFPFTGIGMGAFRQVANLLYPFFLAGPDAEIPHAHNIFLQVGVDLGLPGLVAWLTLLILVCVCAWLVYRRGRRQGDAALTALGAGLLASQAALVVHGLTDAATWGTRPAVVVWVVWGLTMAGAIVTEPNSDSTPRSGTIP
jgi:putative inorganic carbon (HCO3(-)) transporter